MIPLFLEILKKLPSCNNNRNSLKCTVKFKHVNIYTSQESFFSRDPILQPLPMLLIACFEIRVEFEASIDLNSVEDESGEMPSIIDEDEWTQQNFGDSLRLAQEDGNQDDDDDDDEDEEDNNTEGRQGNTSDDYDSDELELEGKSFHTSCC